MGHKGPVLRPRCIGPGRARTQLLFYSILFYSILPLLPNKREIYFVDSSTVQLVLYRRKWQLLETCNNSKTSLHYAVTWTRFCISVHKFVYKPNTNVVSGICSSIPCQQREIFLHSLPTKGNVPPFLAKKVPVVVVFNSVISQYRPLKTPEIRASVIEDMKSRRARSTACQLCPRQFNTARNMHVRHSRNLAYCCLHSRWSQHESLSQPPARTTCK